jgi:cytochrome c oxidase subunit II
MKPQKTLTIAGISIVIILISLWYGQNNGLLPVDASTEAIKIDRLFNAMIAIATGLFILVQGTLIYSLFAFRQKKADDSDAVPVEGNVLLEIVWTAIPAVIVLWLSIYSQEVYSSVNQGGFIGNHMAHANHAAVVANAPGAAIAASMDGMDSGESAIPASNGALTIKVSGLQYAWIFNYPDTGIVSGELHLPVNRPVKLDIEANDVIHAFWVPQFRLKQDAIPGTTTHLSFTPNRVGEYPVICAELCGAYHGAMKTRTIVHSSEDYLAWQQSQQVAAAQNPTAIATRPMTQSDRMREHVHHHHMPETIASSQIQLSMSHVPMT